MIEAATTPDDKPILPRRSWVRRAMEMSLKSFGVGVILWLILAYLILPWAWTHYEHHPKLEDAPKVSTTAQGIPGDPLNVALLGSESTVVQAMLKAGWDPADSITLGTCYRIARSVLRHKPYPDAPVSNLFLFGRKQDLAFERPAGRSASRRHHVRFWRSDALGRDGEPLWCGAVTFDRSVGFSHTTGQITHHIGPDIDAERDALFRELRDRGLLRRVYQVTGVGATLLGRNGGHDPYWTDGELTVGVLTPPGEHHEQASVEVNPDAVRIKEQLWTAIRPLLDSLPTPDD